jgi:hypothetical protein
LFGSFGEVIFGMWTTGLGFGGVCFGASTIGFGCGVTTGAGFGA